MRAILKGPAEKPASEGNETPQQQSAKPELTPHVISLQDSLREKLAAKVEVKLKKQDTGQIVIHFGSNDDFERIVGQLRNAG